MYETGLFFLFLKKKVLCIIAAVGGVKPCVHTLVSPVDIWQYFRPKLTHICLYLRTGGRLFIWLQLSLTAAGHLSLLPRQKNFQTIYAKHVAGSEETYSREQGNSPFVCGWFAKEIKCTDDLLDYRAELVRNKCKMGQNHAIKPYTVGLVFLQSLFKKRKCRADFFWHS